MAASCCGGEWDLFLNSYRHKSGCSEIQVGSNKIAAEERMAAGANDAFGSSRSLDPSYQLGKKKEEDRRVKQTVEQTFGFPVGGRRRRGPLL